jgi:hypothetical protein
MWIVNFSFTETQVALEADEPVSPVIPGGPDSLRGFRLNTTTEIQSSFFLFEVVFVPELHVYFVYTNFGFL